MRFTWALVSLCGVLAHVACGESAGRDPFASPDAKGGAGGEIDEAGGEGGRDGIDDPTIGGPCLDDAQCADGVECTVELCDAELERCRYFPNDARCDDGLYCNGSEVCDASLGCRAAAVPTCSDSDTCTIDTCVEATQSCRHEPRDADGDEDPVRACGGGDCRDDDALVSSSALERCANDIDDDCDGDADELDCVEPRHDRCSDAFEIEAPGAYELSLRGASRDYAFPCAGGNSSLRDVVVAVMVPQGEPVDVDVIVASGGGAENTAALCRDGRDNDGDVSIDCQDFDCANFCRTGTLLVAASDHCGTGSGEIGCSAGAELEDGGAVARLLIRRPQPGAIAVLIAADAETDVLLKVAFRPSEPSPSNETCGTARPIVPDVVERATLAGLGRDLETACGSEMGELVYGFELDEPRDVRLQAACLDDFGAPVLSLRNADCAGAEDELTCRVASPTELFARALAPGRYNVALSGTAPCDAELVLRTEPPSDPPADEGCSDPPPLSFGETAQISLADHVDAIQSGCLVGAPDAARSLELSELSDVLLVQTGSDGDRGAVMISEPTCSSEADNLSCRRSSDWPVRTVARRVGPGSLRAVVETAAGNLTALTAFVRPASETTLVHRADDCSNALEIPETGGRFQGNTANAFADYDASCDYGGQPAGGAPDQLLVFTLTRPRRMVFDLFGSDYDTLLVVRDGASCPGGEIFGTCSLGRASTRSFLDVELPAGSYTLQIDGYNGVSGAWMLEVFSSEL